MKTAAIFLAGALSYACSQPADTADQSEQASKDTTAVVEAKPSLELIWETDTLLTTNESVLYDPSGEVLYVSNIAGKPTDEDGVGFISKLSTDGQIQELEWVSGLDAPKGMAIHEGSLYVTNINELVEIDLSTAKVTGRYPVEGAAFLNDVTVGNKGVYFSDMNTGKLHLLAGGEVSTVMEGLEGINGLAFHSGENRLYMLNAGGLQRLTAASELITINGEVTNGDGLVLLDEDVYLVSRWQGEIWLVKDGVANQLLDSKREEVQTADIGFIPSQNLVLVPRFFSNKVSAYKLTY